MSSWFVLDFFVVCDKVLPFVTKMIIDEEKKFVLTKYERIKRGKKASDSDHATEIMDINLSINGYWLVYGSRRSLSEAYFSSQGENLQATYVLVYFSPI